MAKPKHSYGLANVKAGPIAIDGDMGTTLTEISETVAGTMTMESEDDTITDFNVEESDLPVESIVTTKGKTTVVWSSYDVSGSNMARFFGGLLKLFKSILTLGSVTGGTGYVNGTYNNVPLTGGTGKGATATIVVAAGAVTTVTVVDGGEGYTVADSLSAAAINLGGTGSGFSVPVATLTNGSATNTTWEEPASIPELELSLELTDKKGNKVQIPRAKVTAKWTAPFAKDRMGQVDFVATVLQPTKAGVASRKVLYANA